MKTIALANDNTAFFPVLPSIGGQTGRIYAANDGNFEAEHLSEPLTEYIVGAEDDDGLLELLEAVAPTVPTGRSFTYRQHDTREAFQADLANDEDIREIGGDFAKIRKTGSQEDGRTDNKGLTMVIDDDQGGSLPAVQQRAVKNLRDRLLRTELLRTEAGLEANDVEAAINWGPSNAAADPDFDVSSNVDASGDDRGIDANIALFGGGARTKRIGALRRSESVGVAATASMTPEQLAGFYGVDSVVTSKYRFQQTATGKAKIVQDKVYLYYAGQNLMTDDPSNVKRFVTMTPEGMFRVYIERRLKQWLVTVEHYSRIIVTSTVGIRKIAVSFT